MTKLFNIKTVATLIVIFVVYLTIIFQMPANGYWVTDSGNKAISAQSMAKFGTISINYPAAGIDKNGDFFPYSYFHFTKLADGKIYSFYPFYYSAVNAFSYDFIAGSLYIFIINSALFFSLTFAILVLMQKNLHLRFPPWALIITTALITPCFFYSLVVWEYGLATLLTSLSLLYILKYYTSQHNFNLFLAGIVLGLGCYIREECFFIGIAIGLVFLYQKISIKRIFSYSIGAIIATVPFFIINKIVYGSILGIHAVGYSKLNEFADNGAQPANIIFEKLLNFYIYLLSIEPNSPQKYSPEVLNKIIIISLPVVALFLVGFINKNSKAIKNIKISALCLAAISSLYISTSYLNSNEPILNTLFSKGLFGMVPILIIALIGSNYIFQKKCSKRIQFLYLICIVYTIILCLTLNQGVPGIIFGPRHFLILIPSMMLLTIYTGGKFISTLNQNQKGLTLLSVAILGFSSLLIEFAAVSTLYQKKIYISDIATKLQRNQQQFNNQYVVSDVFWLAQEFGSVFYDKNIKFLAANKSSDLPRIITLMKKNNVRNFTLIVNKENRIIPAKDMMQLDRISEIIPVGEFKFEQCKTYNLYMYQINFK
ncbi:hypothetical protein AAEX28_05330 [Lentisphaerota bacterium WC36G]|nr:hypothetical protein LJT99_08185 [Lentisphaerae bacterium WC36]